MESSKPTYTIPAGVEDAMHEFIDGLKDDQVENPKHYMVIPEKDVEAMHIIRAVLGDEGYKAYCHGNMIKYVLRKKGNLTEDLAKAGQYSKMYMGEKL